MRIIRVTTPLGVYSDFSHVPQHRMETASDRGKRAHDLFAAYARGLFIPKVDWDLEGYYKSLTAWYDRYVVCTLLVEERIIDDKVLGISGQVDFVGVLRDIYPDTETVALIDWKTPISDSPTYHAQIAAYRYLASLRFPKIEKCGTLHPNADGKAAKMRWTEDWLRAWNAYLNALYAYRYFRREENDKSMPGEAND